MCCRGNEQVNCHRQCSMHHKDHHHDYPRAFVLTLVHSTHQKHNHFCIRRHVLAKPNLGLKLTKLVAGGGTLLGCQNREFGRARRSQRLSACPLLYVDMHGFLRTCLPAVSPAFFPRSIQRLRQGCWHQAAMTVIPYGICQPSGELPESFLWCLYLNGPSIDISRQPSSCPWNV